MCRLIIRLIAIITAFLTAFVPDYGLWAGSVTPVDTSNSPISYPAGSSRTEQFAYDTENSVNTYYTDSSRSSFRMENSDAVLTHRLKGAEKTADLTDKNGNFYACNTFETFYTTKGSSVIQRFENSVATGRENTLRLGAYYYECHIRDLKDGNFYVDKAFHIYGDRLFAEFTVLADKATEELGSFGAEISLPVNTVNAVYVGVNGENLWNGKSFDGNNAELIAFDTTEAGVLGFVIPAGGSVGRVTVEKTLTAYTLHIYANYAEGTGINDYMEEGGYELNSVSFGTRIYTDSTHSFEGAKAAAEEERNPLTVTVKENKSGSEYIGYDDIRGCYTIKTDYVGFNAAYQNPDLKFEAPFTVENNTGADRNIYFRVYSLLGMLECAMLYDGEGNAIALDAEVCKNFRGDGGEPIYSYKDYSYADMYFPIVAEKNSSADYNAVHLYQNFGNYPLKQISSIEFNVPYYHLSTGVTETNCIMFRQLDFYLPDFRTFSGEMWEEQPQHNSTGTPAFMGYRIGATEYFGELAGTKIDNNGPTYCDETSYFTDANSNFSFSLRHVEMPQTDENRTYYQIRVTFNKAMNFTNFRRDFDIFYFDGRFKTYSDKFYIDKSGNTVTEKVNSSITAQYHALADNYPAFGFQNTSEEGIGLPDGLRVGCNFALAVKEAVYTKNGVTGTIPLVFRDSSTKEKTVGCLTADWKNITFSKGDTLSLDIVLLPYSDNCDPDITGALKVREDSCINPVKLTAKTGTAGTDSYIPSVKLENGEAQFTIEGSANNCAILVTGLTQKAAPTITAIDDNGNRTELDLNGGCDFSIERDGSYGASFVVNLDEYRSFEVKAE